MRDLEICHRPYDSLSTLIAEAPETFDTSEANKIVVLGKGRMPNDELPAIDIVAALQCDKSQKMVLLFDTHSVAATESRCNIDGKLASMTVPPS